MGGKPLSAGPIFRGQSLKFIGFCHLRELFLLHHHPVQDTDRSKASDVQNKSFIRLASQRSSGTT
jgi:hypothetical protein